MQQIIRDGGDVHHYAASKMFGGMPEDKKSDEYKRKRHMAKFINFGIFYGMGARKLGDFFDITLEEAKVYYNGYLDAFPGIRSKIEEVRGVADTRGYVRDIFGRRRRMRPLTAEERRLGKVKQKGGWTTASVRAEDKMADAHKALNAIIQGGAADMVKESMIRCHALLRGTKSFLVNQIHDELVFEIHVDEMDELLPKIKEAMTTWDLKTPFQIPFGVDVSVAKWDWSTSEASKV